MRKCGVILSLSVIVLIAVSFSKEREADRLRRVYSRPSSTWPLPFMDSGIAWQELAPLPESPIQPFFDSLRPLIELGKMLFFDPRLSGSGKISCASCHQPELSWTDGKQKSTGHNGLMNKRNSPSLQNVWFYKKLFWDGRASSLEDQAFAPINSESEMAHDMRELPRSLQRIKGYEQLFKNVYGEERISPDRIAQALATFQRSITSRKSRFDLFLEGQSGELTDSEIRGLHVFRTKARCMNCHHGALFSDNQFHNNGFAGDDKGLYNVTHNEADEGKMKTPSLRDVMKTRPWMQDGMQPDMATIIQFYDEGLPQPNKDHSLRPLKLSRRDKNDLLAFLNSISADPQPVSLPELPM
jgi:cytochrome c peroxidase